jgi:transposase
MRATTLLSKTLQLKKTRIVGIAFDDDGLVLDVAPSTKVPRCSECFCKVPKVYDRREGRRWRHLDLASMKLHLRYDLRRVDCRRCGVVVELVPWAEKGSWFTYEFEDTTAYLLQQQNTSAVAATMRISWPTVGSIARRVVDRVATGDALDGLTVIGIDELSYRRHHEYVTVVVDHLRRRVVWASRGKSAATVQEFFDELGPERTAKIEVVTIDMSPAYIKAVRDGAPNARIIFDRFHVQRLAQQALDEVRRDQVRSIEDPAKRRGIKGTRFALLKNAWNLNDIEGQRLAEVQRTNKKLYRAYLLKETLAAVLDRRQVNVARAKLLEWCQWATRSQLKPFAKLARTIKKHTEGILGYVQTGLSNGIVEGLNGKIRTLTRRAYGFHSASSLIGLIFLCCSGITLQPVHKRPVLPHNL